MSKNKLKVINWKNPKNDFEKTIKYVALGNKNSNEILNKKEQEEFKKLKEWYYKKYIKAQKNQEKNIKKQKIHKEQEDKK